MIKLVIKTNLRVRLDIITIADVILYKHSSHKKHILSGNEVDHIT